MADWKSQIHYNYNSLSVKETRNYNPSYHAYAYSLMYQHGAEQNHENQSSWAQTGDLSSYNSQTYYTATTRSRDESPPHSPEDHTVSGHCHYQGSGVVYLGDTQADRLLLAGPHREAYDTREHETRRTGCDSTSDSEAHTSPDSWSPSSSREGSLPNADPVAWVKKDLDSETSSRSPDPNEDVSSSLVEEQRTFTSTGNAGTNNNVPPHAPKSAPKNTSTNAANNPKAKARAAFSESQMNSLVQRFSVQRYLTPAEMKNLAEMTGLTYKQVKTWFQNRRMKLRRHQKDNSWVSERYITTKKSPVRGSIFHNIPAQIPHYQGEARPQLKEPYNQHIMEAAFKKAAPQNLAIYLAAGYPSWSSGSPKIAVPTMPQATGWSMPHYEYNSSVFNSAPANNSGPVTNLEGKDGELVNRCSFFTTATVQDVRQ